jgi:hypothetical protein
MYIRIFVRNKSKKIVEILVMFRCPECPGANFKHARRLKGINPFHSCHRINLFFAAEPPRNPCDPSPCGPYSDCRELNGAPQCSCKSGYFGKPPSCRPECTQNGDCAPNLACIREKCANPCANACGLNAECNVISHTPRCSCQKSYVGDPYSQCSKAPEVIQPVVPEEPTDPCKPSPCGTNAICQATGNRAVCSCQPGLQGDPFIACRPECILNSECASDQACINQKCQDPCPGTCGINAACHVQNHFTICMCEQGYVGDPFTSCQPKPRTCTRFLHKYTTQTRFNTKT